MSDYQLLAPNTETPWPIADQDDHLRSDYYAGPATWFACWHPERPVDPATAFHDCCRGCLLAAQVATVHGAMAAADYSALAERLERFGPAPRSAVTG